MLKTVGSSEQLHLQKKLYPPFKAPQPLETQLHSDTEGFLTAVEWVEKVRKGFSGEKFLAEACFHPMCIQLISSSGFFANMPRRRRSKSQSFKCISSIDFLCISAAGNSKTICMYCLAGLQYTDADDM